MEEIDIAAESGLQAAEPAADRPRAPSHEMRTFDLPPPFYIAMFACYAIFFGALALLVGGTFDALGMVIISVCFAIMYFGTATVMVGMARSHRQALGGVSEAASGRVETLTGSLSYGAAAVQILIVPSVLGLFGLGVLAIRVFDIGG